MRLTAGLLIMAMAGTTATVQSQARRVFDQPSGDSARTGLEQAVAYVMSLDADELKDLVPRQSGIYFTDCPHCDGGAQDRADWNWTPEKPHRLACRTCGETYPDNKKYPDADVIIVPGPDGQHRYAYYENPDGYRIFFRAHADYLLREYLAARCRDLAYLYEVTDETRYAERAALILDRFAQVYPGYACKFDYPFRQKLFTSYDDPEIDGIGPFRVSKWSWWAYMGISRDLLQAYDVMRFWDGLDSLGDGSARRRIEKDLLGGMVDYVMSIREVYSNMSPVMWCDFIYAGRLLQRHDWIAEALRRATTFMDNEFLYDGFWKETAPSYCAQVVGLMDQVVAAVEGYEPASEDAREALAEVGKVREACRRLKKAYDSILLPDGGPIPVNDTWARAGRALEKSSSRLLPGVGLSVLAAGSGDNQVLAWLNNTSGPGHKHHDALSIGLHAFGGELLRDIGYTHTAWRAWSIVMMSHNTVVVDGLDSAADREHKHNRLRCFVTDGRDFHLTEAENDAAYPDRCERFRRTLILVGKGASGSYLIDLFQVHGGGQHDWLLHGPAAAESTMTVRDVAFSEYDGTLMNPGTEFAYPKGESYGVGPAGGYGFVKQLQTASVSDMIRVDMRRDDQPDLGTRSWVSTGREMTAFLGQAPRLRQAERNDQRLPDFMAPMLCLRVQGDDLESTFAAVHEPVKGKSRLQDVQVRRMPSAVVFTVIQSQKRRDTVVIGLDGRANETVHTPEGLIRVNARWAVIRTHSGRPSAIHIVDGGWAAIGETTLSCVGTYEGTLAKWGSTTPGAGANGWLQLPDRIETVHPDGAILLTFADGTVRAFNTVRAEAVEDGTIVYVRERPAFEETEDGIRFTAFPQREIEGQTIRYIIHSVGHVRFQ